MSWIPEGAAERARVECLAQGLPPDIEDQEGLRRIAAILRPALREIEQQEAQAS